MNTELRQPLTELAQGRTLAVHNGRGRAIVVFSGQVWVTQDDDLRDTFVGAGESFQLDRDGLALATALDDSRLLVLNPEPRAALPKPASYALALRARRRRHAALARAFKRAFAWLQRTLQQWPSLHAARSGMRPGSGPAAHAAARARAVLATRRVANRASFETQRVGA